MMECSDLLTCGECHLVFSLSDIVSFIRHKQSTCRGGLQEPDQSDDDDDDDDYDDNAVDRNYVNDTAPAVVCGTDEDEKTVVCANGTERTISDIHQDEHSSLSGSTSYLIVIWNCEAIRYEDHFL